MIAITQTSQFAALKRENDMETKNLEALKKFFTVAIAGFNFVETTLKTMGQPTTYKQVEMKKLYQESLDLLEKMDLSNVESTATTQIQLNMLMNQMEILAAQPNIPTNLEPGGICHFIKERGEVLVKRTK